MSKAVLICFLLLAFGAGCRQESAEVGAEPSAAAGTPVTVPEGDTSLAPAMARSEAVNTPSTPSGALPSPEAASNPGLQPVAMSDVNAVLEIMTQSLRKYSVEKRQVPKTLNEVVAAGYLAGIPKAPPGKKFAIKADRVQVVLVNE